MDNEDKQAWCTQGEEQERAFVAHAKITDWAVALNPDKDHDKYTHDLTLTIPGDLKTMETPWNMSEQMFGIPTPYAASINQKDFIRYGQNYPNIVIVCDVHYGMEGDGRYAVTLPRARWLIQAGRAHRHEYKERKDDTQGNAKASYIFDIRDFDRLIEGRT